MKSRPFILKKLSNPFVFSVGRNTSNHELNKFFGDLGDLVRDVDKEVNQWVERVPFYEGTRASIMNGMKSSFYVCASGFYIGDIIRKHEVYFPGLSSGNPRILLDFNFSQVCSGCVADDKVKQMAWNLDYVDMQLFGDSHIPTKQDNDNW
jgi:hypothetical protein